MRRILLNAEAFGFGPSAAIAQLFSHIRPHVEYLGYMAEGHAVDLHQSLDYNVIRKVSMSASDAEISTLLAELFIHHSFTHFFSASNFRFARLAKQVGFQVGIVDPLTWYWDVLPIEISMVVDLYLAQDFIGVRERLQREPLAFPPFTLIVPPLVDQTTCLTTVKDGIFVNLGGLKNPWMRDDSLLDVTRLIASSVCQICGEANVRIATNDAFAQVLRPQLNAKTYASSEMMQQLNTCQVAIMTPGLGNLFEASSLTNTPVIWLPPMNDSQGQQLILLMEQDSVDWFIDWHEFTAGGPIDYFNNQQDVLTEISARIENQLIPNLDNCQARFTACLTIKIQQASQHQGDALKIHRLIREYGHGGSRVVSKHLLFWAKYPPQRHCWQIGGGIVLAFESDVSFTFGQQETIAFAAHLPGFTVLDPANQADFTIRHHYSEYNPHMEQIVVEPCLKITSNWKDTFPEDAIHLFYGVARTLWLERNIYPVHGACVGWGNQEDEGFTLLVGPAGSGKTSLCLEMIVNHQAKLFSGDKTLVKIHSDHSMYAIAGTKTLTLRKEDAQRFPSIHKVNCQPLGERVAFQLEDDLYWGENACRIRRIAIISVNDMSGPGQRIPFSPMSALHSMYPIFLDRAREDVWIGGSLMFWDGTVAQLNRIQLQKQLETCFVSRMVEVIKTTGSLHSICGFLSFSPPRLQGLKTILYGICGIGNGHFYRELPVIRHLLAQGHRVVVFTYGEVPSCFQREFVTKSPLNLMVISVINPYLVGSSTGLDFKATADQNKGNKDFLEVNALAMEAANTQGPYHLVISDYEMVSAQYAYAKGIPLVTMDQQSKFLYGKFPQPLGGTCYYQDEIERLRMFFPTAHRRIVISFFDIPPGPDAVRYPVQVMGPILRPEILQGRNQPTQPILLVYMSAQNFQPQQAIQWIQVLETTRVLNIHMYVPPNFTPPKSRNGRLHFHPHGHPSFHLHLLTCKGIISHAGHSLMCEAMYLRKPVLCVPLAIYEQQLSAAVIHENGFGVKCASPEDGLRSTDVALFIRDLDVFTANIQENKNGVLITEPSNQTLLDTVDVILKLE